MHAIVFLTVVVFLVGNYAKDVKVVSTSITDAEIQAIVDKLVQEDQDYGKANVDFKVDYQNKTTEDARKDVSKLPLFSYVNASLLNRPTYQVFLNLRNQFNPDVTKPEQNSTKKSNDINTFLDTIMQTEVFSSMWQFLQSYNVVTSNYTAFKSQLRQLWFGEYPRDSSIDVLSSSGWEHVFCGEWKTDGEVDGLHNWVQYYELEKQNAINYYGYLEYEGDVLPDIQYTWETYIKPDGSFLLGASVEFNFSVFTLCYLTKQGDKACKFTLNDYKIAVTSYEEDYKGQTFISTTYPEEGS